MGKATFNYHLDKLQDAIRQKNKKVPSIRGQQGKVTYEKDCDWIEGGTRLRQLCDWSQIYENKYTQVY